jgi:hypothetical protein
VGCSWGDLRWGQWVRSSGKIDGYKKIKKEGEEGLQNVTSDYELENSPCSLGVAGQISIVIIFAFGDVTRSRD